jgi:hypothetical protein
MTGGVGRCGHYRAFWHGMCPYQQPASYAEHTLLRGGDHVRLSDILWLILAIVLIVWLVGLIGGIGGSTINLLLIIALVILLYNLFVGPRTVA